MQALEIRLAEDLAGLVPEWENLAETLQKEKYSVIMFDFRGHGESTTIDDPNPKGAFWSIPINAAKRSAVSTG